MVLLCGLCIILVQAKNTRKEIVCPGDQVTFPFEVDIFDAGIVVHFEPKLTRRDQTIVKKTANSSNYDIGYIGFTINGSALVLLNATQQNEGTYSITCVPFIKCTYRRFKLKLKSG